MTTITFKYQGEFKEVYQGKNKEVYQNDAFIEDYSNDPEALAKIVRELTDLTCNLSLTNSPWDGEPRIMSDVRIGYRGRVLRFDFYNSLADSRDFFTEHEYYPVKGYPRIKARGLDSDFLKDSLYSLLCTIRFGAGAHELSFREFCDQYGYDEGSRKAYSLYERCCDFSRDISRVFSAEEIESFPS